LKVKYALIMAGIISICVFTLLIASNTPPNTTITVKNATETSAKRVAPAITPTLNSTELLHKLESPSTSNPQTAITEPPQTLSNHNTSTLSSSPATQKPPKQTSVTDPVFSEFKAWLEHNSLKPIAPAAFKQGLHLAQVRQAKMKQLIQINPAQALHQAVSLKEYAELPVALKPYVEQPFSERAHINILLDEPNLKPQQKPRFDPKQRVLGETTNLTLLSSQTSLNLARYGSRAEILSKEGIAVQGIHLEGFATIYPSALQLIKADEIDYIQHNFPARTTDTQHDFFTGEKIQGKPVLALAGGQIFYFASTANLERLNLKLEALEKLTGPQTGSQILFADAIPLGSTDSNSKNTPIATRINQVLATPELWSTTPKKVFFIRVSFPDKPTPTTTKSSLEATLAKVSTNIEEMSQGESRFSSITVNDDAHLAVMPQNSTVYYNFAQNFKDDNLAYNDAINAMKTADSSFNPDNYDMVGIFFPNLWDGQPGWASLGGKKLWIFDYDNEYLLTHEFGHTYGLNHAHFWQTTDGSVVGAGTTDEYGDSFDFMGGTYDDRDDYHPEGQNRLGWLVKDTEWQDITASGSYRLKRFDHVNASGNRALRISRGSNGGYYWLGHRQKFDDNKYLENGIYLIWLKNGANRSWLLDTTPRSASGSDDRKDGSIILGRTYSDTSVTPDIHITPIAKGGTEPDQWIDVQINLGTLSGNNAPNLSGINGATQVKARSSTTFSALATDPDGDALAYYWDFGDGVINPNNADIEHQWAVGGTYTVKLTVSDMKGGTASTEITVTVEDPLNVWTQRTSNSTQNLQDLASDSSKVVAIGSSGHILKSVDGATWSATDLGSNIELYGIHYANGLWVSVGDDYRWNPDGWVGVIYTSSDAITWTRRHFHNTTGTTLRKVTYGNNIWVAVGNTGLILTSSDGLTWTTQTSGTSKKINDIAFANGQFVAIGSGSGNMMVLTSTDGINWSDRSSGTHIANNWAYFSYVDYLYDRFIASGWFTGVAYSTDNGANFYNNQSIRQSTPANTYGNGLYFSAGVDNPSQSDERDINLISTDGMNWTPLTTVSQPNRNAALFFKNTFITVGNNGSIYQSALINTDTTPNIFSFNVQTGVPLSTTVTSAPVQITGINISSPWSVVNGEACVSSTNNCSCDIASFSTSGLIDNNQYICVQHTSANNYAGNVSSTLTIGGISSSFGSTTLKNSQTITFAALANKLLSDTDFTVSASASSGLTVSFNSLTPNICSVAGTSVHLLAVGTCTLSATQSGDAQYEAAPTIEQSFTVSATPINGTCGNDHGLTLITLPVNLCTSGIASVVTVETNRYLWSCSGSNGGTSPSCAAGRNSSKTLQTLTFGSLANKTLGEADFSVSASASSGLPVSFSSSTPAICSVTDTSVKLLAIGICTLRASQSGDATYEAATAVEQSFTVSAAPINGLCGSDANQTLNNPPVNLCTTGTASSITSTENSYSWSCIGSNGGTDANCTASRNSLKQLQTITFTALANKILSDPDFTVSASTTSGLSISFSSLTTTVCSVTGNTVHLISAGTCTLRASQSGDATYEAATPVEQSFTVSAAPINGLCGSDANQTLSSVPTNLCSTGTASSVSSSDTSYSWMCLGSNGGTNSQCTANRKTIRQAQTLSFDSLTNKTLGEADFTISATASSGLAVSFSSLTPNVCSVTGTSVHLLSIGTCTIRASQSGDASYEAATPVEQSFTVSASTSAPINGVCGFDDGRVLNFFPNNLCTQGIPSSVSVGIDTYQWSCLGINGGSSSTCSALQELTKIDQKITFTPTSNKRLGDEAFWLSASSTSGLTINFNSLTLSTCFVVGNKVHLLSVGTCTIRASQDGNNYYNAAAFIDQSFLVFPKPSNLDTDRDGVNDRDDDNPLDPNWVTLKNQSGATITLKASNPFRAASIKTLLPIFIKNQPEKSLLRFYPEMISYRIINLPENGRTSVTILLPTELPLGSRIYSINNKGQYHWIRTAQINGNQITLKIRDGSVTDADKSINAKLVNQLIIAEPIK